MRKIIVTTGSGKQKSFIDIDGVACAIGYAELLCLEGKNGLAVLADPFNSSVTPELEREAKSYIKYLEEYDQCVIVDMSDPEVIGAFISLEKVSEIYDHHFGFEKYWEVKLGNSSTIEYIGAAATLIWEEFKKRGFSRNISHESTILLSHAILSNTANLQSNTTTARDQEALAELEKRAKLGKEWRAKYFREQQKYTESDINRAIKLDTKECSSLFLSGLYAFGQIEIWDAGTFLENINLSDIFTSFGYDTWVFNLMSIGAQRTTILSNSSKFLKILSEKLGTPYANGKIELNTILFRKEIIVHLQKGFPNVER